MYSKYESTSLLCTVYSVLCCQAVIKYLVYRFMCRLRATNNSLVMSGYSVFQSSIGLYDLMDDVCTDMLNLFKHYYAGLLWSFGSDGS